VDPGPLPWGLARSRGAAGEAWERDAVPGGMVSDTPSNVVDFGSESMLAAALQYARLGWYVLPIWQPVFHDDGSVTCGCGKADCQSIGKHPHGFLARNGQEGATTDETVIRAWFERVPKLNIAINLHKSGLVAVDIDTYAGGDLSIEILEAQHGPIRSNVTAVTGGGGEHRVFDAPAIGGLPGRLGKGIDLKANGYIVVEPSIHRSGQRYTWEGSSDPREYAVPSAIPDWIRDLAHVRQIAEPVSRSSRFITEAQVDELRSALTALDADDYHQWVQCGMALKGVGGIGFELWDEWSQRSDKYQALQMGHKWRSFGDRPGGLGFESIFHWAQTGGWVNPLAGSDSPAVAAVPIETVALAQPEAPPATVETPQLPGVLGAVYDWIEATSRKPQPIFSTQAALAFGATVLGRRYRTTAGNWPSLYFLNIGKSASGKEHAKWAIEKLLEACDLSGLIGPAGYTSDSGVLSSLHRQPSHIGIIDEFGKVLESASIKHGARAASAMKTLMEAWGRCDGTLRPQGYSTFGMSSKDADALDKQVVNPALTLLAMTTPESFFDAVGSAAARDGFLNRFLIVETDIGRQVSRMTDDVEIPAVIVEWAQRMRACDLVNRNDDPTLPASSKAVALSPAARRLFAEFDAECIGLMDAHDSHGLAEMFGRSNEIAMRVALVLALACEVEEISAEHAAWAIQYVRDNSTRITTRLITAVADSEFEAVSNQVMQVIRAGGTKGATERELYLSSRKFKGLDTKSRVGVLLGLANVGEITKAEFPPSVRGRVRTAWVAVEPEDD
jgi:Bifunctional DNA primase/polymerase, N-terminal/Primase C terminal 2 (PriCT-2)/Protein of unknown function (DUF3987)